jgi:hypothetical protein
MNRVMLAIAALLIAACQDVATPPRVEPPALSTVSVGGELKAYLRSDGSGTEYVDRTIVVTDGTATPIELCFISASTLRTAIMTPGRGGAIVTPVAFDVESFWPLPQPGERYRITAQDKCDGWLVFTLEPLPGRP